MDDRGLALILVGDVDRRVLPALSLAASLPDFDAKAIHVSVDHLASEQLARDWMDLDLPWVPLHIEEVRDDSFIATVKSAVEREAAERSRVIVIVPEVDLDRWWQILLHRSRGRRIARGLHELRRVSTVVVPYPVELAGHR